MNTSDIIKKVSTATNISIQDSKIIFKSIFNCIGNALIRGEKIEIRGFGTFKIKTRSGINFRNPKTGERISNPVRKVVYFRPSKRIKTTLKNKNIKNPK